MTPAERAGEGEDVERVAKAMQALSCYRTGDGGRVHDEWALEDAAQILTALAPLQRAGEGEDDHDDARHITWDHGRRTLCGKSVDGDPGDFYLPLGKAPRHDEGGAWCWSCLQLQDEASAQRAGEPPTPDEVERAARAIERHRFPNGEGLRITGPHAEEAARAALDAARQPDRKDKR